MYDRYIPNDELLDLLRDIESSEKIDDVSLSERVTKLNECTLAHWREHATRCIHKALIDKGYAEPAKELSPPKIGDRREPLEKHASIVNRVCMACEQNSFEDFAQIVGEYETDDDSPTLDTVLTVVAGRISNIGCLLTFLERMQSDSEFAVEDPALNRMNAVFLATVDSHSIFAHKYSNENDKKLYEALNVRRFIDMFRTLCANSCNPSEDSFNSILKRTNYDLLARLYSVMRHGSETCSGSITGRNYCAAMQGIQKWLNVKQQISKELNETELRAALHWMKSRHNIALSEPEKFGLQNILEVDFDDFEDELKKQEHLQERIQIVEAHRRRDAQILFYEDETRFGLVDNPENPRSQLLGKAFNRYDSKKRGLDEEDNVVDLLRREGKVPIAARDADKYLRSSYKVYGAQEYWVAWNRNMTDAELDEHLATCPTFWRQHRPDAPGDLTETCGIGIMWIKKLDS